ncbi:MAG: DUF4272 domain-containing protein [Fibrobacterota bacterium]|nr:MAG: DUF4272 domain-containing protein [Fibrobacterota bacterium]
MILNALTYIYAEVPTHQVLDWISRNDLVDKLASSEKTLLSKANDELTIQDSIDCYWGIESLWALMWVGSLIKELDFAKSVLDPTVSCPDLQKSEDAKNFKLAMKIRSENEILEMLELHHRLHCHAEECRTTGTDGKGIERNAIIERRKALEWVCDTSMDWDSVEFNT